MTQQQRDLAEANQGLAWMVANRFHRPSTGEDARQELGAIALLALCEAAQGFDEHRGYMFSTYATIACTQAILDERRQGGLIHTPCYLSHADMRGHRYRVARDHVRNARYGDVGMNGLAEEKLGPVEQAMGAELRDTVRSLPWRQSWIIERKAEGWTNTEIAHAMGCSKQHVTTLVHTARARLQARLRRR